MSRFLNAAYRDLEAYVPGEQPRDMQYIKLNTNESPYPPAPSVVDAVNRAEVEKLRLYSDPECTVLREKLAALYGVKKENVYLANGSDDILNFAFMALCDREHGAIFPEISYGFYQVFADLYGIPATRVPLCEDFSIDHREYCHRDGMIVIANPNAPTGMTLSLSQIEEILQTNPDQVVLIDEAYVDFGGQSCVPLIHRYPNLLVVQTFSKSRSMAGARLGFAIADAALIADLELIKYSTNPYNINRLTQIAGAATVDAEEYTRACCREIMATREYTVTELKKLGFRVLPSSANFIFAESDRIEGGELYRQLKARGVLVRHFDKPRISNFNRITIGTRSDMDALLCAVKEILGE
ncbi:MAG: histidinol-phosphate transaminase [Clostridia bacterium]|nr:histidinol-phosphate transaminase [Clostridia bacterium]